MKETDKTPFFSVIIPLYNKDNYIAETLKSVLYQTFKNFEILIINDGSTDDSLNIVRGFTCDKISVFNNENKGLSYSRNFGIRKAKADFIAFIDADDLWHPDFLETIYSLINTNKNQSIFTTFFKTFTTTKHTNYEINNFNNDFLKIITNYRSLSKILVHIAAMVIHKDVFNKVGFFDESVNYGEDEDFYIRAFSKYNLVYYTKAKALYRIHCKDQITLPNSGFKKIIPDFENYITLENKTMLKPYLDAIHYKLIVLFKMERNKQMTNYYKKKVSTKNLGPIKKIKYYLPIWAFYHSKKVYLFISLGPSKNY